MTPSKPLTGASRLLLIVGLLACLNGLSWAGPTAAGLNDAATESMAVAAGSAAANEAGFLSKATAFRDNVATTASGLVLTAMGFLGVPYKRGGTEASVGFDCSGFVRSMYEKTLGLVLPRRAEEQARATDAISKDELRPGDLVFFNTMRRAFSHVGIYVGDGQFIHAPRTGAKVRLEDMRTAYWTKRFNGARRVDGVEAADLTRMVERAPK